LVILLGIVEGDTAKLAQRLAAKVLKLRLWPDLRDAAKSWASSVVDNNYGVLVVSQFTLFATFKGTKPNFNRAMGASEAEPIYEAFVETCQQEIGEDRVQTGEFGADMQVDLCNDGPVTVELVGRILVELFLPSALQGPGARVTSERPVEASPYWANAGVRGFPQQMDGHWVADVRCPVLLVKFVAFVPLVRPSAFQRQPRSEILVRAVPGSEPIGEPLTLTPENVEVVLQEARYHHLQNCFGYVVESSGAGITGKVDLVEVEGPMVFIHLHGAFWHNREDVLKRVRKYLMQRIPEIAEVDVEDPDDLIDE
ncbi:DTD1, partial [Symbiodinium pilosum]